MTNRIILACLPLMLVAAVAVGGPIWCENGGNDAGPVPGLAQVTVGAGPLAGIDGRLDPPALAGLDGIDDEDMFAIMIPPGTPFFSARTEFPPTGRPSEFMTEFDTQLFLFDSNGLGIIANNNQATTAGLLGSQIHLNFPPPGIYYLALSGFNHLPISKGGLIFIILGDKQSPPDGPGGTLPIVDWVNPGQFGDYFIELQGATFATDSYADFNLDGVVNGMDLAMLLGAWTGSAAYSPCPPLSLFDLNVDCKINGIDLAILLGEWG